MMMNIKVYETYDFGFGCFVAPWKGAGVDSSCAPASAPDFSLGMFNSLQGNQSKLDSGVLYLSMIVRHLVLDFTFPL